MKYIEVYETIDRFDYYRAIECLESNNIEFQKLHEYRLNGDSSFGGGEGGPAILRVKEIDVSKVKLILEEELTKSYWQRELSKVLKDKSTLDKGLYQSEIQKIRGQKIEKVKYIFANEIDFDFDYIHSVDFGIGIQLENGNFIWWVYEYNEVDLGNDFIIPHSFELKFHDILNEINRELRIVDVSDNDYWSPLIGKSIKDIKIYSQEFSKHNIITDLVIETDYKRAAIFLVKEPVDGEEQIEVDFSIANDWIIAVFDEDTIIESERI